MFRIHNLFHNPNIQITEENGPFRVLEYLTDRSVSPSEAMTAYYSSQMNLRRRQVLCDLSKAPVTTQAGAMQWMLGDVSMTSGVKNVGNLVGKALRGKVSGESTVKPEYTGTGIIALEPTYQYILLEDLNSWNGGIILQDGMFLACDSRVKMEIVRRTNLSSTVGGEGLFNLCLSGSGIVCLESNIPRVELIEVYLEKDVIKIDGSMTIAWSKTLEFTVERSAKTLIGSALSGEGLVNVYRGTGKILMAPVAGAAG